MSSQLTPRSTGAAKTAFRTTVDDVNSPGPVCQCRKPALQRCRLFR